MSKFFFNTVCPDRSMTDMVGQDCRNIAEAKDRARETARELVFAQLSQGEPPSGWIEVEDESHRPVFMLPLRAVAS